MFLRIPQAKASSESPCRRDRYHAVGDHLASRPLCSALADRNTKSLWVPKTSSGPVNRMNGLSAMECVNSILAMSGDVLAAQTHDPTLGRTR